VVRADVGNRLYRELCPVIGDMFAVARTGCLELSRRPCS
jgi:hypothetical protein